MTFHPTFRTNVYLEMQLSGKAPSNSYEFHLQLWKNQNKTKQKIKQKKKTKLKNKKQPNNQANKKIQPTHHIKTKQNKTKQNKNLTRKQNIATCLTNEI